jgi:hypothetical protein
MEKLMTALTFVIVVAAALAPAYYTYTALA